MTSCVSTWTARYATGSNNTISIHNIQCNSTPKNIKLQPVPPSVPSEALSVRISDIHNASSGIDGDTGCNFIFFSHNHC